MKQKLQAALEQRYGGAIGSKNKIHEEVAAAYGNLITSEEQIPAIVAGVEPLFKTFQSVNDKLRSFENKKKEEVNQQPSEPATNPEPKSTEQPNGEMAQLIKLMQEQNEQMRKQNEVLTARFDAFENAQKAKSALANAEATFKGNDYVKKYTDEATDAWERATEMYDATGKTWTAEELQTKAMGYFNKAVSKKGVDTTKPFQSDGGGKSGPGFKAMAERLKAKGKIAVEATDQAASK